MLGMTLEYVDDEVTEDTMVENDMFTFESIDQDINLVAKELPEQIQGVMCEFPEVFTAVSERTAVAQHVIHKGNAAPIRQSVYWMPYTKREALFNFMKC